ncbi:MAG: hypothetical protein HXX08_25145 [Chloroflexi bacterium]|uniref:Uncharacterized protein n=1 Tax=Candidatus Chlorohelix allophototropha TaxID=3003348 RepID=A0A8T7MAI7_9CHLR|nr:hypothetical protein [Chloroflexota bacterium]NWJ49157.1 hypothetical protein [Chloroflexota bacterium]WJW68843.1 hypothetical protein OZ401_004462 [Chloroflexota bacterium L227-S17]
MFNYEQQVRHRTANFLNEAQQQKQAKEALKSRQSKTLKQKFGEKLINMGEALAQESYSNEVRQAQ